MQIYAHDCLKISPLLLISFTMIQISENNVILTQVWKIIEKVAITQNWKLSNVGFWPKPNAFTKLLNWKFFCNQVALFLLQRLQKDFGVMKNVKIRVGRRLCQDIRKLCVYKQSCAKYILRKIKISSRSGQDQKSLMIVFDQFLYTGAKNSFLEGRPDSRLHSHESFEIFPIFPDFLISQVLNCSATSEETRI